MLAKGRSFDSTALGFLGWSLAFSSHSTLTVLPIKEIGPQALANSSDTLTIRMLASHEQPLSFMVPQAEHAK